MSVQGQSRNQKRQGRGGNNASGGGRPDQTSRNSQQDPGNLADGHPPIHAVGAIVLDDVGGEGGGGGLPPPFRQPPINCQLPPLAPPSGPAIEIDGRIGGAFLAPEEDDPRVLAVSMGFPISVHPLRIPNARAQHSSGSSHSVIDYDFVRLSGLLHTMVPLRPGVDDVKLISLMGSTIEISGYVDVVFDAFGFEFKQRCWVMRFGLPLDIQLGNDWVEEHHIVSDFTRGFSIVRADAKRVRNLEDVYVTY